VAIEQRACVECASADADLPIVQESGTFTGWICRECDRRLRHRRGGWKRKFRRTVRRYVG